MRALRVLTLLVAATAGAQETDAADAGAEATPPAVTAAPVAATVAPAELAPCPASTTVLPQPQSACAASARLGIVLRVARIALEAVMGAGIGFLGELTGAYIGLNADTLTGHESAVGVSLGAAFGAILAVAPGVWLGGSIMGGDGSFGWTMLGGAVGTVASAVILGVKTNTATTVVAAAIPVLTSILGYELSSNRHRAPKASTEVSLIPTVGPNGLGVVGVF